MEKNQQIELTLKWKENNKTKKITYTLNRKEDVVYVIKNYTKKTDLITQLQTKLNF